MISKLCPLKRLWQPAPKERCDVAIQTKSKGTQPSSDVHLSSRKALTVKEVWWQQSQIAAFSAPEATIASWQKTEHDKLAVARVKEAGLPVNLHTVALELKNIT